MTGRVDQRRSSDASLAVVGLEQDIRHLYGQVGSLHSEVVGVKVSLDSHGKVLNDIAERVHSPPRPQWGVLLTALAASMCFVLAVCGLSIAPIAQLALDVRDEVQEMRERNLEHAHLRGSIVARLESLSEEQEKQREADRALWERVVDLSGRVTAQESRSTAP